MKHEIKWAIVVNALGFVAIVAFFIVLEMITEINIASYLVSISPAIAAGLIGGFIGAYISFRRRPDERMQGIMKNAGRNAFWTLLLLLPFVSIVFMFLPAQGVIFYGLCLFGLWILGLTVFYLSAI